MIPNLLLFLVSMTQNKGLLWFPSRCLVPWTSLPTQNSPPICSMASLCSWANEHMYYCPQARRAHPLPSPQPLAQLTMQWTEGTKLAEKELMKTKSEQWMCLCWFNTLYYKMKIKVGTKEEDGTAGIERRARLLLCLFLQKLDWASY